MDPQVQASFIPKKPLISSATAAPSPHLGILWIVSVIIFAGSVIAAGAAFVYDRHLQSAISSASESLNRAQEAYDPKAVDDLVRLNSRITQAKVLLQKHVAPSTIFSYLSENTLQNVSFNNFSLKMNPSGTASITLKGSAQNFESVALQSDSFGNTRYFKNILFSDVNITSDGQVGFSMAGDLDPSLFLYKDLLSGALTPSSAPAIQSTGTSSSSTPQP